MEKTKPTRRVIERQGRKEGETGVLREGEGEKDTKKMYVGRKKLDIDDSDWGRERETDHFKRKYIISNINTTRNSNHKE